MRVLVTRPAAQAADWVAELSTRGIDAAALPLIEIRAIANPAPVVAAWQALARMRLVAFVSPNAAQSFFVHRPPGAVWPASTLAASPGPGSTRVLQALGVPAAQIVAPASDAAQFDSESLWAELSRFPWADTEVLMVRGDGGREWLASQLRTAGAHVDDLSVYRRAPPTLDGLQCSLLGAALDAPAEHVWIFSSAQAIDHLAALAPLETDWEATRAIATHPRIVARAQRLGIATTVEARPALAEVIACIQSFRP